MTHQLKDKLKIYWHLLLTELTTRTAIVKIKINGQCVNRCSFCLFHDDPRRLNVADLAGFFDKIESPRYRRIDINGGEPTLHPRFTEICEYLAGRFKGKVILHLGTNLIPWARRIHNSATYRKRYQSALDTFDVISVGCDDEHRNIDALEQLGPEIVQSGHLLFVNVLEDYCSPQTRRRIRTLEQRLGLRVSFSQVHHYYRDRPVRNDLKAVCRRVVKELLINCDGNAYYCFHQEFERPLFNLFTVTATELNFYLNEFLPSPYQYCVCCPCYDPGGKLPLPTKWSDIKNRVRQLKP